MSEPDGDSGERWELVDPLPDGYRPLVATFDEDEQSFYLIATNAPEGEPDAGWDCEGFPMRRVGEDV